MMVVVWRSHYSYKKKNSMVSRFMEMVYLAKEDTRKAYSNIYVIEGEIWNALLRWNQDVS